MTRLFVSDLHLDAGAPEAVAQFLDFLDRHASSAESLYILGDLFESWIGDDDPDSAKLRVCAGLRALSGTGVACYVLHGNRDFLLGSQFCRATGVRLLPDPIVADFDGERVLLTHGDSLCTDDHAYQELRSAVRAPEWQRRFLALPLADRELLSNQARAGSRQHLSRTPYHIQDVNTDAVRAAFAATSVSRIVHGHTHRPAIHDSNIDNRPVQRIVLGAWYEQGSYLEHHGGQFELKTLPR
jgi:UDP-2,3-diacylglucosamine hydrolase